MIQNSEIYSYKPGTLLLSSDGDRGVFSTLQGEGLTAGAEAVFVRLQGCNLRCSFCDTPHTVFPDRDDFWTGVTREKVEDLAGRIRSTWQVTDWESLSKLKSHKNLGPRLVVTGGEPMRQKREVASLISRLLEFKIEIETNGTIDPGPDLATCQINCSPKLSNSGNSENHRYRKNVICAIAGMPNSVFKFVVKEVSDLTEIDAVVTDCRIDPEKVIVMPEGVTQQILSDRKEVLGDEVVHRGYKLGERLHIEWFGNKRGT